jgi:hypothetical protein
MHFFIIARQPFPACALYSANALKLKLQNINFNLKHVYKIRYITTSTFQKCNFFEFRRKAFLHKLWPLYMCMDCADKVSAL